MQTYVPAPSPPHNLEELRALVGRIRRGAAGLRLGNRASDALAQLVDAPRHTAISSISELAAATGVNPSTLTRLTHRLGYKGFHEFQDVFRRSIASGSDESGASRSGSAGEMASSELVALIAAEQIRDISATTERLIAKDIEQICSRLMMAPEVRVLGARHMHGAAITLVYGLSRLRSGVAMLGAADGGLAHAIAQLGPKDVVVVLSNAPHPRGLLDWVRIVAGQGIGVITVSDARDRSLARAAEHALVCEMGSSSFGAGTTSVIAALEALLAVMARRLGEGGQIEIQRRDRIISELEAVAVDS